MPKDTSTNKSDIICPCSGTRQQRIIELVAAGFTDLDQISRKTGAASGCGSCEWDINALITQQLKAVGNLD